MKKLLNVFLTGVILLSMVGLSYAATELKYKDRKTGFQGFVGGEDGAADVNSRSDSRAYYNSRDKEETYSLIWNVQNAVSDKHIVYWKNTSSTETLVISSVGFNSNAVATFDLNFVSGTAVGTAATPTNLNKSSSKDAAATAITSNDITGLTVISEVDHAVVGADSHEELRLADRVRLGQNDAISIRIENTASDNLSTQGVIFGFYE